MDFSFYVFIHLPVLLLKLMERVGLGLVFFILVNESYSKLNIFIEGGNNKNIHSNKTVHCLKKNPKLYGKVSFTYTV